MADREQFQERSERATPKRLHEASEKGQVPRSRELSMAAVTLMGAGMLFLMGGPMLSALAALLTDGLSRTAVETLHPGHLLSSLRGAVAHALLLLAPFFAVLTFTAILAPLALGGWSFSISAVAFKAERLSPMAGLKRVFAVQGLVEMVKAMAKFLLIGTAAVLVLRWLAGDFMALGAQPPGSALPHGARLTGLAFLILAGPLALIAAADVPFQLWNHAKKLRMTKQEVKDESKETEGRPEVRGRIRSVQQELARRRMIHELPSASVVVTNPTHYAVALRYEQDETAAPVVVAKGRDHLASKIREVAEQHRVPIFEAPPLARALYASTRLGGEIPANLYLAVAQVLTYVYQLRRMQEVGGPPPVKPDPRIDDEGHEA